MNSLSNEDLVAVEPFARKPIEMTGARPMSREPYSYPAFPIETSYGRKKIFAYKPAETVETDIALEPAMFSENGMGFLGRKKKRRRVAPLPAVVPEPTPPPAVVPEPTPPSPSVVTQAVAPALTTMVTALAPVIAAEKGITPEQALPEAIEQVSEQAAKTITTEVTKSKGLPSWAIPVGIGVLVLGGFLLMRKR